jgi:GntR family transcriptional regulator
MPKDAQQPKKSSRKRATKFTLYAHVKEQLRREILDGSRAVHSKLPSEDQLTKLFKVSRITVRQALADLQRDGLVFKVNGKGSFVSKPKAVLDISMLRGFAEAAASLGYETFARVISLQEIEASRSVATHLMLEPKAKVVRLQRLRFLNREPVSFDITYVRSEVGAVLANVDLETRDVISVLENECKLTVVKAREAIDAMLCDAETGKHLQLEEGGPILHIERTMLDQKERPVLYENLYYHGNSFRYGLERIRNSG